MGTSRNIHKIVAVYWLILNLTATFRGGVTVIQLGALGNSQDVKEFGYERFLEPLIKDLKLIEDNGIYIDALKSSVGVKIFCVCADNVDSVNGVKRECVLAKHLTSFHPVTGFPPDILHDFFEGVMAEAKRTRSKNYTEYEKTLLTNCGKSCCY